MDWNSLGIGRVGTVQVYGGLEQFSYRMNWNSSGIRRIGTVQV